MTPNGEIIPLPNQRKTNKVRLLGDFRNLNRQLKRKLYPIPKIREMILKLEGFKYATSLDLNMGYYHIRIRKEASNISMIILPCRNHKYKRLPTGVCNSSDNLKEEMISSSVDLNLSKHTPMNCS